MGVYARVGVRSSALIRVNAFAHAHSIYDNVITTSCIPEGVRRTTCDLGGGLYTYDGVYTSIVRST